MLTCSDLELEIRVRGWREASELSPGCGSGHARSYTAHTGCRTCTRCATINPHQHKVSVKRTRSFNARTFAPDVSPALVSSARRLSSAAAAGRSRARSSRQRGRGNLGDLGLGCQGFMDAALAWKLPADLLHSLTNHLILKLNALLISRYFTRTGIRTDSIKPQKEEYEQDQVLFGDTMWCDHSNHLQRWVCPRYIFSKQLSILKMGGFFNVKNIFLIFLKINK